MTKFFNKFKKPCFFAHFSNFGGKKFFPGKCSSVMHNFIQVSNTIPRFRKRLDKETPGETEGRKERRKDRLKDGQTLFHRTLPATAGGPIISELCKILHMQAKKNCTEF